MCCGNAAETNSGCCSRAAAIVCDSAAYSGDSVENCTLCLASAARAPALPAPATQVPASKTRRMSRTCVLVNTSGMCSSIKYYFQSTKKPASIVAGYFMTLVRTSIQQSTWLYVVTLIAHGNHCCSWSQCSIYQTSYIHSNVGPSFC